MPVGNIERSIKNNLTIKLTTLNACEINIHTHDPNPNLNSMLRGEIVGSKSARHTATSTTVSNKVLVAVKADKVISNTALAWALTHIVHSSDSITLLAVYSTEKTGKSKMMKS